MRDNYAAQIQSGTTLIEMTTVIVIVGILAAFAIPKYTPDPSKCDF